MPKTINDIIPPSRRKAMGMDVPMTEPRPAAPPSYNDNEEEAPPSQYPRPVRGSYRRRFPLGLVLAALAIIVLAVLALYAFAGAKVHVTPVISETAVSGEFAATGSAGDLPFEVITVSSLVSVSVPAEGTKEANDPAQGTVTVYNAQEKPQQLIKNTRFESPTGLIFRIRDSITVPAGTPSAPGELKTTVYADEGGEKYNIAAASFTVPGLKGSATFDLVYARSSEPMVGGFSGARPSVSQATKDAKATELRPKLDAELAAAAAEKVLDGYVLLPGGTWTAYELQPDGIESAGTVDVRVKGILTAVIFPKDALAKAIAFRTVGAYSGQPVTLQDADELSIASSTATAPAAGDRTLSFTLTGSTSILWVVDANKIAGAVAGKSRDAARTILSGYPEVGKAVFTLRPFWAGSYPSDPADIKVVVEGTDE